MGQRADEIDARGPIGADPIGADQPTGPSGATGEIMSPYVGGETSSVTWSPGGDTQDTDTYTAETGDLDTDAAVTDDTEIEAHRERIEQTRAEMSSTVDAIQQKLSPQTLATQAKETVREATIGRVEEAASNAGDTAMDIGNSIVDTIRQNPVPAALAGIGIGWLFMSRPRSSPSAYRPRQYPSQRPGYGYDQAYGYTNADRAYGYTSAGAASQADDYGNTGAVDQARAAASGIANQVQDSAGQVVDQVQNQVGQIGDTAQQAVSNVGDTAQDVGSSVVEMIRANPIPAALAGIGLGWFLMQRGGGGSSQPRYGARTDTYRTPSNRLYGTSGDYRYGYSGYDQYGSAGQAYRGSEQGQSAGGGIVDQAQNTAGQAINQVQDTAGQVVNQAQDVAGQVVNQAQQQVSQFGDNAQQAMSGFQRMMEDNPLAVGAGALALGLAIGLSIPETPQEHQLMGDARDSLVDKAQQAVQDTAQKVQNVAQEAVGAAKEEAQREQLM